MGEKKVLRVRYLFRDKVHEVTVNDLAGVQAPIRSESISLLPLQGSQQRTPSNERIRGPVLYI